MTAEVIDARLTDMIRVMAGSRSSLFLADGDLSRVKRIAYRADAGMSLTLDAILEAHIHLRQAIATLVAVHDNLLRAEQNLAEVKR